MRRWGLLLIAIILNSIGHSMTIVTNMGSMPWPASIVNIMHTLGWSMTATIFTEGIVVMIVNAIISWEINWLKLFHELVFLLLYSLLMQWFAGCWRQIGIDHFQMITRLIYDLCGLVIAFIGFALYQHIGIVHPHDDFSATLKHYLTTRLMQLFNIVMPVCIVIICGLHNQVFYAVNIGTVVGLLGQRYVVDWVNQVYQIKVRKWK